MPKGNKTLSKKSLFIIAFISILFAVGGTAAYLIWKSSNVSNDFNSARSADPEIIETFENNVKSDVKIKVPETGYSVYVRAAIVITWKNEQGEVLSLTPVMNEDYTISIGADWTKESDGFYYFDQAVNSGGETGILIEECKPLINAPTDGYTLDVQIIAQTIQAIGSTDDNSGNNAKADAWKQ